MTKRSILLFGATGTIGRALARELVARGHDVLALVRPGAKSSDLPRDVRVIEADFSDPGAIDAALAGARFDTAVSCLASRTGAPKDAWAVDHDLNVAALSGALEAGVDHFVLLSAICVQKPKLEFQRAKLTFEDHLKSSGVDFTILRPTAFFKSLSGQVARVKDGKSFLSFGNGRLTACTPISDRDLAKFLADCVEDPAARGKTLPVGGPGPALTPNDQAEILFRLTGRPPKTRKLPVAMMDAIIGVLSALGTVFPKLKDKAEFAKIGRYYATESMLVWDADAGRYAEDQTPSYGSDRLEDHYAALLDGRIEDDRGDHAVF